MNRTVALSAGVSALVATLIVAVSAVADGDRTTDSVPRVMPYAGYIDVNGQPMNNPSSAITVSIFDGSAAVAPAFTQAFTTGVVGGRFSVTLGPNGQRANGTPVALQEVLGAADDLYLGVTVDGVPLSGRQRLAPNAFAFWAAEATDFRVNRNLDVSGTSTLRGTTVAHGDILKASPDGQLGASSQFVFRDTGDTWLRLNNGAGSNTYADLAIGNGWTEGNQRVQGDFYAPQNSHNDCYWTGWGTMSATVAANQPAACTSCVDVGCNNGYWVVNLRIGHQGGDGNYWTGARISALCCRL